MLNDAKLRSLKPKETIYRETDFDGLCLEVKPTGKKFWRYRFRLHGKQLMMTLGVYPAVGLAEARKLRDEAKAILKSGVNPVHERAKNTQKSIEKKQGSTFKEVAIEYKKEKLSTRSKTHQDAFQRALDKDILKVIGHKDVRDVNSADVLTIMKKTVARIKRQKNYGTGEVTAMQNRMFIGGVMRYAIVTLRAEYDPTYAVKDVIDRPEIEHARPLTKKECAKLRKSLEEYRGSTTVKNAGLLMLYTMLRTIEIRKMKWSFVDLEEKIITFPKDMMKKRRIHIVPLSSQAYEIILEQKQSFGQHEFVFPSVYKKGMLSATTLNRMLDYMGLSEVTAHDFRATASTLLNEKDYDEKWIEKQLAHAETNKTKASYDHSKHLNQRRKMLQDWADIVDSWSQ